MSNRNHYKKLGRQGNYGSWWKHLRTWCKRVAHKKGRQAGKKEEREQ